MRSRRLFFLGPASGGLLLQLSASGFRAFATLLVGFGLIPTHPLMAQTFTVLHHFTARSAGTNNDGSYPAGRLIANASGDMLYGTANLGGSAGLGVVFAVNTDGTGFTNLHSFAIYTNGTQPRAGVILSGSRLYGTAWQGGVARKGAVFALNTDGTGYSNLHNFTATVGAAPFATNSDGANPLAGLVLLGNTLYGAAEYGGNGGNGTVFAVNTNGTAFATVHSFAAGGVESVIGNYTNVGGIRPNGGLVLAGNTLYGTTIGGGRFARGTVFKLNTNGSGFTALHNFTRADYHPALNPSSTNSDGANPVAGLVLSGDTLYGTTENGGAFGQGVVFSLSTNGGDFTTLHSFRYLSDGYYANAGLFLSGNTLYGAAIGGGDHGGGTVFSLNTDGTGFMNLHSFNHDDDGAEPDAVVLLGNSLYGAAKTYGSLGDGTVFRFSFALPQLNINLSGPNVILTWPMRTAGFDYTGFTLQSTTTPISPAIWSTNSFAPSVVNGQNTVTNPVSDPGQFFRLKSQ